MLSIPNRLFDLPFVEILLKSPNSCILQKTLNETTRNRQSYIAKTVLSLVTKGKQQVATHQGEILEIRAGEIGCLTRGIYTITDLVDEGKGFETYLFFIEEAELAKFFSQQKKLNRQNEHAFFKQAQTEANTLFLQSLIQHTPHIHPDFHSQFLSLKLQECLFLLSQPPHQDFPNHLFNLASPRTKNLKDFLETHYDKPLTVEDYAYLTGRSLSSFRREFKRHFDTTPQKWLIDKRMEKAQKILLNASVSVTEVAYEVGYENVSHFIKTFKNKFTLTPKQFLTQQQHA